MRELSVVREARNSHPFINICFNKLFRKYIFLSFSDYKTQVLIFSGDRIKVRIEFSQKTMLAKIKFYISGDFGIMQKTYMFEVVIMDDIVKCISINKEKKGIVQSKINNNLYKEMMKWKKKDCLIKDLYWGLGVIENQIIYCSDIIIKVKKSIDAYKNDFYKKGF